jgi:hypothetical protein
MKKKFRAALVLVLASAIGLGIAAALLLRDPLPRMLDRRSSLASATEGTSTTENGYVYTPVRLTATSGLALEMIVRRPAAEGSRRLPVALVLGGHHTGKRSVSLVGDTPGIMVVGVSYPFFGNPRPDALTFITDIPDIRAAFLDTPPAIMLAVDYLLSRADVDTAQIEGVGVSLGAPFVTIAAALDPRISRVWAIHGSGGSYTPLEASMRRPIPFAPLRVIAASTASVIIAGPRLDPVLWAGRIAPRPFVMINALADERMPLEAVHALYRSARQPKELIEMPGGHVRADSATLSKFVDIVVRRMTETQTASTSGNESSKSRVGSSE